ncbi:MAG TPA: efflux transporter outer membrane subunit [Caldimonas sp.]
MSHVKKPIAPRRARLVVAIALALAGCAVGPDFKTPPPPQVADASHPYTPAPVPAQTASAPGTGGAAQLLTMGQDMPAQWWQLFRSDPLDQLIRSALTQSPTLAAAQATLRQALENYQADSSRRQIPAVTGQLGAQREKLPPAGGGTPGFNVFTVYNASVNVSYTVDAFGGIRRELEGLEATVDFQRYQLEAAYLSLTTNLVTTAIQEASLRAQLQAIGDVIDAETKAYDLVQKQARFGAVSRATVLTQAALLAQTRATLPAIQRALAQTRHQLSVLAGRLPGDPGLPEFTLETLQLPVDIPVSLPSEMLKQRPDIRASEALLHAASAQVGVATANLYPQLVLSGSVGSEAFTVDKLFTSSASAWSIGAALLQPIFNGGALQANKRAAIAGYDAAAAQYRQTVLNAFLNVADTLRALDLDAEGVRSQEEAASLAEQQMILVGRQYKIGAVSFLVLLEAQRIYQQTRVTLAAAQANRYADTAALFQALGGGWWNRKELADISHPDAPSQP